MLRSKHRACPESDVEATAFTILLLGITCLAAAVGGGLKIYKNDEQTSHPMPSGVGHGV
jgi:hypothetical protein